MKSTVFATIAGIAIAGDSLRSDGAYSSSSFSSSSASNALGLGNLGTSFQSGVGGLGNNQYSSGFGGLGFNSGSGFGGGFSGGLSGGLSGGAGLGGASGLAVSTIGALGSGGASLSSATGLSNTGTGAILVTPGNTGSLNIGGPVITNGDFPKADLSLLSSTTSSLVNNFDASNIVINNAYAQNLTPSIKSIDSLFTKLPTSNDIDNMILSADSVGILRTVQAVGASQSLPCNQIIAYLLEVLGRVKAAVQKKTFAGDQLKIVVDAANQEIIRLQGLYNSNLADIDKLGTDGLKTKLNGFLADLQSAYTDYNKYNTQIPVIEAQINGNNQEIQILMKNSDAERNKIANDKLKISDIVAQINSIQGRINDLRTKQTSLQGIVDKGDAGITANDRQIVQIKATIDDLQGQIDRLTNQADNSKSQTKDLQVKVGRLRTDISVNDAKRANLLKENASLNDRIALEKKRLLPDQLTILNDKVTALKNFVPNVQAEIDRHYYYCYGDGKVQVKNQGGVVIYIVRGEAFGNYLRSIYGNDVIVPASTNNADVLLNRINIFGQSWIGAFGYPFQTSAFGESGLSINGSFECSATNSLSMTRGSGTISKIGANFIQANGQRFNLGSCSRLQSTNSIPSVGQQFYWSGVPGTNGINLYSGTCF